MNRNKDSVVLDLHDPVDRATARAATLVADVVVENFRPGVMDRLGLGHAELSAENPRLVYCSITGFGRGGGAALPGYDLLIQAVGGLMSITGEPDSDPQKVGVALVDVLAGLFAGVGILAALRHRESSGRGQRVEVDLLSSLVAALTNQGSAFTAAGVVAGRLGNRHPSIAPYELVRCADRDLALAVGNDRQFTALCDVLGEPGLAADPRFVTNPQRVRHRDGLRAVLAKHFLQRPAAQSASDLAAAGVPAGVVNDIAGAFDLAARLGLDPIVEVPRPGGPPVRLTRNPITLSATPARYLSAPPRLPAPDQARNGA